MDYMTVREAAEKWGVSVRRVQYLCMHNMITGAVQFGRVWTIPNDAAKPRDGRYKVTEESQKDIVRPFQSWGGNEEMLSRIIEFFLIQFKFIHRTGRWF